MVMHELGLMYPGAFRYTIAYLVASMQNRNNPVFEQETCPDHVC
jgi:hypothetical protein